MSDQDKERKNWGLDDSMALPALPPGEPAGRPNEPVFHLGPSTLESGTAAEPEAEEPAPEPRPAPVIPFQDRRREPEAEAGMAGSAGPAEEVEEDQEPAEDEEPAGFQAGPRSVEPARARSASPAGELYSEELYEEPDDEPFDLPGTEKLGIIGGKGVGKSFLFQGMVYRTQAKAQAGAVSSYLDKARLFYALDRKDKAQGLILAEFNKIYRSWVRLPQTTINTQRWYRLRLSYRTGILGGKPSSMDVEFFDGSGEGFFEATRNRKGVRAIWREGFLDAKVMVFCLPLWAAFPGSTLSRGDWRERDALLAGFERVIRNYEDLRREGKRTQPVKSVLAFTMADDPRSALQTLHSKWIAPYMDNPQPYLRQLRSGAGVARYLANARSISEALHEELTANRDPRVSSIPQSLDFGGRPWLIPLSAVEGRTLDRIERDYSDPDNRPVLPEPVPVHVELPLLVALCERHNALM